MTDIIDFGKLYPWLTKDLFQKILRTDLLNEKLIVIDFTVKAAVNIGENYGSDMLRVNIQYCSSSDDNNTKYDEMETVSLVIKAAMVSNHETAKLHIELGTFQRECASYQIIIPEIYRQLAKINYNYTKIAPKCLYADIEQSFLVFEDLKESGYTTVDINNGLDIEHFRQALKVLAIWHASTGHLIIEQPSTILIPEFNSTILIGDNIDKMNTNTMNALAKVMEQNNNIKLAEKLTKFSVNAHRYAFNSTIRNPDDFNVLIHGDTWSNNFMFNQNQQSILVDFQCVYYGAPALDLLNLFYSSSQEGLGESDWNYLIQFYHNELSDLLMKLNFSGNIPTLNDITKTFSNKSHYFVPETFNLLAMRYLPISDERAINRFMSTSEEDDEFRIYALSHTNIIKSVQYYLEYFDRMGLFDLND